tara:strand:- start:21322 stop:21918 length:597 start_codon:yes stop_codon:yes gene_type:complete
LLSIISAYPITSDEYSVLEDKFGQLCHYQSWQLLKKNTRNNHTNEEDDIAQEMRLALIRSACYYKRQVYIEKCFEVVGSYIYNEDERVYESTIDNVFTATIVENLHDLWENRTRHGASRQKFGPYQEAILFKIVKKYVPKAERPDRLSPLVLDSKFNTYCKAITWNAQKSIGKKITREKSWRTGLVSLSEYDYLGGGV